MLVDTFRTTDLTEQERLLADYILANPQELENHTVRSLATASLTSPSTVVRLCKKLGFEGFSDFRLRFVTEQKAARKNFYVDLAQSLVSSETSTEDALGILPQFYNSIVYETNRQLDPRAMDDLAHRMLRATSVDFYGTGMNYHAAQRGTFNLQALGIQCNVFNEANIHMLEHVGNREERLSFLLSHTGSNKKLLEIASVLKRLGMPTVAITSHRESPLAQLADVSLGLVATAKNEQLSLLSYSVSLSYLLDLLYVLLLSSGLESMFPAQSAAFYKDLRP